MIKKLKDVSFYITCISIIVTSLFGVFKFYDFLKSKSDKIKANEKAIISINKKIETHDLDFKQMKIKIKKLRVKGNGKEMKKILDEEERELEKKRKRFLGIF